MSSFLWVRCPEAATWQRVKEMAKRHPHKWDMGADGTLIAVLFTAVEVLSHCYIEVRNYVWVPHFTAQPLRYTGISQTQRTVNISSMGYLNTIFLRRGVQKHGYSLGWNFALLVHIKVLFSSNGSWKKIIIYTCSLIHCPQKVREKIKRTAESKEERVTGRKAIQHKSLWRSLTFLYARIESLYMVLPGTLTI